MSIVNILERIHLKFSRQLYWLDLMEENFYLSYSWLQESEVPWHHVPCHSPIVSLIEWCTHLKTDLIKNSDALRDLVSIVQFKKREKHHGGVFTKNNTPP